MCQNSEHFYFWWRDFLVNFFHFFYFQNIPTFLKLLPQKLHLKWLSQNKICKIALLRNTSSKLLHQKMFDITLSKLLFFLRYFFKEDIFFKKNLLALIYSSLESSEELSKPSIIWLTTFCLMYLNLFGKYLWVIVSIFIERKSQANYC